MLVSKNNHALGLAGAAVLVIIGACSKDSSNSSADSSAPAAAAAAPAAAYDLSQLDARVRSAVEAARAAAVLADDAFSHGQEEAQSAAAQGGTTLNDDSSIYVGEVGGPTDLQYPQGVGVSTEMDGTKFTGDFADGAPDGFGELVAPSAGGQRIWTGRMANGIPAGAGKLLSDDGSSFAGLAGKGAGVIDFATTGLRYEGETQDGAPAGYGVMWDENGAVSEQGVWSDGRLTTPLGVNSP